jgi:DNA-binding XRE family transcriptional regulator
VSFCSVQRVFGIGPFIHRLPDWDFSRQHYHGRVQVEAGAAGLKAMREKRGLTQRKLAHDLGISQNYIPAIEAGSRKPGPKLQTGNG